ncbi:MAG: hypothetical protein KFF45_06100, partial [Thioalkalivibrio sp.]|nr:hypothetical protein [Thioalkalivibrio sp.]
MRADGSAREAVRLLEPLIGVRGQYGDRTLELVEVLVEGPQVAVLDATSGPSIQTNQYGDPLTRQPRILTLPVFSEIEADAHPVLRALLPDTILVELRRLIAAPGTPPPE